MASLSGGLADFLNNRDQRNATGPGSGLMVQRCGFFVAPIREHLQEMGLIIPTLKAPEFRSDMADPGPLVGTNKG